MKLACDGSAPSLGVMGACKNLTKIYEHGNEKFGIPRDPALVAEYKQKAYLITPAGRMSNAMTNMPAAGQLIS